jgi:putative oxidoreductase
MSRPFQAPSPAALVLRLTVGTVLVAHGLPKIDGGVSRFAEGIADLGIPFPTFTAWATVTIEVLGGAMLVVGLLTRLWSTLATLLMAGTTLVVKMDVGLIGGPGRGTGMELDLVMLAAAFAITLIGPGIVSLDHVIGIDRARPSVAQPAVAIAPTAAGSAEDTPRVTISLEDAEAASVHLDDPQK